MDKLKFPFEKSSSQIFGSVWRPIARVGFWSNKIKQWVDVIMIVDTGADYTILPRFYASDFGISLHKDCETYQTFGIGGSERVYLLKNAKVKLGKWERFVPIGFLDRDDIPPLLGRQEFLEIFKLTLANHSTVFSVE
jgi:predicted aspartyl protease